VATIPRVNGLLALSVPLRGDLLLAPSGGGATKTNPASLAIGRTFFFSVAFLATSKPRNVCAAVAGIIPAHLVFQPVRRFSLLIYEQRKL